MKDLFPGYYRPNESEFKDMWLNGLFVFDANVLLDIYRYSDETADSLLKTFEKLEDRIWIPYQAALEYHRNINTVIASEAKSYSDAIKGISELLSRFSKKRGHPFLSLGLYQEIQSVFDSLNSELESKKKNMEILLTENPLKDRLATILSGKIGEKFDEQKLAEIYAEGEKRFSAKIPPGYEDAKSKQGDEKYGDLVIWIEIIEKAKNIKSPLIFVTGDTKSDWFLEEMGKKIGPRPELIAELKQNKKIPFYIYSIHSFLEFANEFLAVDVAREVLDEVKEVEIQTRDKQDNLMVKEALTINSSLAVKNKDTWYAARANPVVSEAMALAAEQRSRLDELLANSGVREAIVEQRRMMDALLANSGVNETMAVAAEQRRLVDGLLANSGVREAIVEQRRMMDELLANSGVSETMAVAVRNNDAWDGASCLSKDKSTKPNDKPPEEDDE